MGVGALTVKLRIPVCNVIICEDITLSHDNKMYILNPFTATSKRHINKFFTYSVIQDVPNGILCFKIQIVSPQEKVVKETEENITIVKNNLVIIKTQWTNISFDNSGQYTIRVLVKFNNDYDTVGSSHIYIM